MPETEIVCAGRRGNMMGNGAARLFAPRKATPACSVERSLCRESSPLRGIDAPTPAREKGLQPYGARYCFGWRSEGGWGRAESPQCARRRNPLPRWGSDAPTPARIGTCRPKGRSHFSFGGERKVCKRKPAARRLREKALYCPFWRRGSLCRAQRSWPAYAYHCARSELAFFRRQNGRAFFPPLPIAALLPRSRRWADLPLAGKWGSDGWPILEGPRPAGVGVRAMRPVAERR